MFIFAESFCEINGTKIRRIPKVRQLSMYLTVYSIVALNCFFESELINLLLVTKSD